MTNKLNYFALSSLQKDVLILKRIEEFTINELRFFRDYMTRRYDYLIEQENILLSMTNMFVIKEESDKK